MTDSPLETLRRIAQRPRPPAVERCDLCAAEVGPAHSHLVDLQSRQLACACRPCYLLFTDDRAHLRYRAVPDRYLAFGGPVLEEREWYELQIPVGLAFLFHNSAQDRMVVLYPGPAGATESELDLPAVTHPALAMLRPDVEALLLRRGLDGYLVPIDACYELVGRLRTLWRGFDGGQEAHAAIAAFFDEIRKRAT
ncbi:DUF5947 family protein [Paractinoplanes durhamensis]|uniref:Uncharacterized protein n=1 Tax=Paractinoplanes durhamensis TaxID=113563 RepID=A0ABQ3YYR9_9ACTN|nr:DUF5947 family protein [Actinoplanes durhamensis]GIE02733.1 hypothetical protein Adu01nite_40830 [Actinoplanes durhamensis]